MNEMLRIAANYLARKGKLKLAKAVVDQEKENLRLRDEVDRLFKDYCELAALKQEET